MNLEACSCFRLAWIETSLVHCQDDLHCPYPWVPRVVLPCPSDFQQEDPPSFLLQIQVHPFVPWIHPLRRVLLYCHTLARQGFTSDRPMSKERGHHHLTDHKVPSPLDGWDHQGQLDNTAAVASFRQVHRARCPSDRTAPYCLVEILVARASYPDRASTFA